MREDVKDIPDDIEEKYDDFDIEIDDSDLWTEDTSKESMKPFLRILLVNLQNFYGTFNQYPRNFLSSSKILKMTHRLNNFSLSPSCPFSSAIGFERKHFPPIGQIKCVYSQLFLQLVVMLYCNSWCSTNSCLDKLPVNSVRPRCWPKLGEY